MRELKTSLALILLLSTASFAYQNNGGRGLMYIHSAKVLKSGYVEMYAHTRFFGKVGRTDPLTGKVRKAVTYWDVQGSVSFNFGISKYFEFSLSPIVYQDTHKGERGYNLPDDLFLRLKLGSLGGDNASMQYGFLLMGRIPTAKYHNIVFEPYSAGTVEAGVMGLISYFQDPLAPYDALNMHFNLGYLFHNDAGKKLTDIPNDTISVSTISSEFLFGAGFRIPTRRWDFSLEFYGNAFAQKPPETAFARENYLYVCPGVTYKAYRWMSLDMSVDIRLTPDNDETNLNFSRPPAAELPSNYPDWRVNLGMKLILLPTSVYKMSEAEAIIRAAEARKRLFEEIIKEQKETEAAEKELQRIKEERIKAEKELERLRRLIEGKTPQKTKKKPK